MLRPMRLIYVFPVLKKCMESLVRTLPEVAKNFMSLFIIMIFYSIIGLHMFMGAMEHRCRVSKSPPNSGEEWEIF